MRSSKEKNKDDRKPRNERKTQKIDEPEVPMLGLMAEEEHAQNAAGGAAEEGKAQKHLFGHSPRPLFGFQLVRAVKCKGKKAHRGADDEKIKYRLHIFILHPNAPFVKGEGQIFTKLWGKGGDFSTKKPRFIICACGMIKKRACYFGKGGNVCKRCFWTAARAASF